MWTDEQSVIGQAEKYRFFGNSATGQHLSVQSRPGGWQDTRALINKLISITSAIQYNN
ncbi:hypothetical protein [Azospirillum sp. TSH64]|uniref:hypothetical protein n=1 Tax=Azospirillum sp. TSH64 TaxID=652740 RepID=UPI001304D883|nr:hypothetical protein [Azospirillum sp. TSH64]